MLLNFHFDKFDKNNFVFEGPYIMLESDAKYKVGVRKIHVELSSANEIQNEDELWILSSNLIDQTPINPRQSLLYFKMKDFSKRVFISPISVAFYPLERH